MIYACKGEQADGLETSSTKGSGPHIVVVLQKPRHHVGLVVWIFDVDVFFYLKSGDFLQAKKVT
jgi:hypothetical protein